MEILKDAKKETKKTQNNNNKKTRGPLAQNALT
jgi:hypothetical protein